MAVMSDEERLEAESVLYEDMLRARAAKRRLIANAYELGMPTKDIAKEFGCSLGTVNYSAKVMGLPKRLGGPSWGDDIGRAENHAKRTERERRGVDQRLVRSSGYLPPLSRKCSQVERPRALTVKRCGSAESVSSRPSLTRGWTELPPMALSGSMPATTRRQPIVPRSVMSGSRYPPRGWSPCRPNMNRQQDQNAFRGRGGMSTQSNGPPLEISGAGRT